MAGSTKNFHPNGLFSEEIFGKVGDPYRSFNFSYINIYVSILHPLIFKVLGDLKSLYTDILMSNTYAIWDTSTKDFIKSTPMDGETGYHFFMKHFKELNFEQNSSDRRTEYIKLMDAFRDKCILDAIIVMPAGLRDFDWDASGKPTEDEINKKYRKILGLSNLIDTTSKNYESYIYDNTRAKMQIAVNELYDYLKSLLEGKHKLIMGKWATRRIQNGTRNVITAQTQNVNELDSPHLIKCDEATVGLYQYLKSILPLATHHIQTGFLSKVFVGPNSPAVLINKETLRKELIEIDSEDYDLWFTSEGLEKTISTYEEVDLRHYPIEVEDHYIGLLYRDDKYFKLFQDIRDLPKHLSKENVKPINYTELFYISLYKLVPDSYGFITRYPVINYGGIYPTKIYLKTTIPSISLTELDDNWEPIPENIALEFPTDANVYFDSLSPGTINLGRLGADRLSY